MAKQMTAQVKVQITGGQATPAPPVGTALGPHGINLGKFVSEFNEKTKDQKGVTLPVIVTIYNDRSFELLIKTPPASVLLKQMAQVAKGSARPKTDKVGKVTQKQLMEIAQKKMVDLNSSSLEAAARVIAGTARNMGIEIVD